MPRDGYGDRWPLGETKEFLVKVQVVFDCASQQIRRNNQLSFCWGWRDEGGRRGSQGITLCGFPSATKCSLFLTNIQQRSGRIEVSPSRIALCERSRGRRIKASFSRLQSLKKVLGLCIRTEFEDYPQGQHPFDPFAGNLERVQKLWTLCVHNPSRPDGNDNKNLRVTWDLLLHVTAWKMEKAFIKIQMSHGEKTSLLPAAIFARQSEADGASA